MSDGGGDTGGGGGGGSSSGDSGGGTKGGGAPKGGGGGSSDPVSYGGYTDPNATSGGYSGGTSSGGGYSSSGGGYTDPSAPSGGGGGSSSSGGGSFDPFGSDAGGGSAGSGGGGGGYSDPNYGGYTDPFAGLNLSDPGVVGGSSPAIHGGMFSSNSDTSAIPQTSGDPGLGAPTSGGGTSASAFAAPEGISGTPQLADLVRPSSSSGGIGSDAVAASDPGTNVFSLLNSAQKDVTDQWATNNPASGSSILPAASSGSPGGKSATGTSPFDSISLGSNPLGTAAAGLGLINNMVSGNKSPAYSPELNAAASSAAATGGQQTAAGTALQQYVSTGTLPAGYEDQVQQAAAAAKQTIISNYANRGLPTDPTKNSVLAQELAQVDSKIPAMRETIAGQLAQTGSGMIQNGLQATGIQSNVYQTLANLQNSQNQQRSQAISNFAASLNGGTKSKVA